MFLSLLSLHLDRGGDILDLSSDLLHESSRIEESAQSYWKKAKGKILGFYFLWAMAFVILVFLRFGLTSFFTRIKGSWAYLGCVGLFHLLFLGSTILLLRWHAPRKRKPLKEEKAHVLEFLGLTPWKEYLFLFLCEGLFLSMGVGLYLWKGVSFLLALPGLLAVAYAFLFFSRYSSMRKKALEERVDEFVQLFTYFGIYVNDGFTVYGALEKIQDYASPFLKKALEKLLEDIDEDKTIKPYMDFSANFEDLAIKEVLLAVYQMVDEGASGVYITQFQHLFGKLSDTRHGLEIEKKLDRLDTLSFLPLAGTGLAMLALTLCVLEIMGDYLNVL